MAVIPGASILRCVPSVGEAIARCNRALSDAIDTVHVHGLPLPYSMPMNTCPVECEVVYDIDVNPLPDT
jgi:hypothetical protein